MTIRKTGWVRDDFRHINWRVRVWGTDAASVQILCNDLLDCLAVVDVQAFAAGDFQFARVEA